MTIFQHKVPANMVGISQPSSPSTVNGSFAVQDVERAIYAMQGGVPVKVGWQAAVTDGQGGIAQLARSLDATYNWQSSLTGFGASGNSSSVTIQYPSMQVLWNGAMQPVTTGAFTMSNPGTGTLSFMVSYQWGLSSFSVRSPTPLGGVVELCSISITATSATVSSAHTNGNWMGKYWISNSQGTSDSAGIPYSDANGNMAW
jgi:hypothetical protein